jgi:hypothetical protein
MACLRKKNTSSRKLRGPNMSTISSSPLRLILLPPRAADGDGQAIRVCFDDTAVLDRLRRIDLVLAAFRWCLASSLMEDLCYKASSDESWVQYLSIVEWCSIRNRVEVHCRHDMQLLVTTLKLATLPAKLLM